MYNSWVKRKLIKRGTEDFNSDKMPEESFNLLVKEVNDWYKAVFKYAQKWLVDHNYIDVKKGNYLGGFCAVPREDETTKSWGAPLSGPRNKVVQIKEKFGRIVVYFQGLNEQDEKKIARFEKFVERKFDCICDFN